MITADEFDQLFDVIIPSDTLRGQEVQERIIGLMHQFGFSDRDIFSMRLALEEGIINAIKHGNRMDLTKSVRITWGISDARVRVVILDEGVGFNPGDIPDPTADENLERPSGRGIMLMKAFLDLMRYNERGNELTLEKKNTRV